MKKTDLIDAVVAKTGSSKKDAGAAIDAVFAAITEALAKEDKVALVGFGTFEVHKRAAREGINPALAKQGKPAKIKIPASKVPAFKAGKALKEAVNAKKAAKKSKK